MAVRQECSMRFFHRFFYVLLISLVSLFFLSPQALGQDFTATAIGNFGDITVMEVSGNYDSKTPYGATNAGPRQEIAKEFFKTHPDDYDFLVIFSNFDFKMPEEEVVAFYVGVRNDIQGIGERIFDNTALYGSNGRLQGTIDMGNIAANVSDALDPGFSFTMGTLSHELLHRWAARVKFRQADGSMSDGLLGKMGSHWSFLLDTAGSLEYGNLWRDNGDGTFTALPGRKYFSPLDLYLMGFVDQSDVPPMLLIENADIDPQRLPEPGVTIEGTARTVTIDDIIAAEGDRIPAAADAQTTFKIGTIFITRPGTFVDTDIQPIRTIIRHWVLWFSSLTDGRGKLIPDVSPFEDIAANPGVAVPEHVPRTTPPQISDGIAWLVDRQQADGRWQDTALTTERDTAGTVLTLQKFSDAAADASEGAQWLTAATSSNLDFLARRLEALAVSGADTAALRDEVRGRQNPDGGWGSNRGYLSSSTDTALALKALAAANVADTGPLADAIDYLKGRQNADFGWGNEDAESHVQTTADVLSALAALRDMFPAALETVIQTGLSWLTGKQNADGGFGNSPSTVYDTAAAMLVIQTLNPGLASAADALTYLLNLQSENGSWFDSTYQTALAVRALNAWKDTIDSDLVITAADIQFTPAAVTQLPEDVSIEAQIRNFGLTDALGVKVTLYDGPVTDATKLDEQILDLIGGTAVTVGFDVTVDDTQSHQYTVAVDSDGQVAESSETNNVALKVLVNDVNTDPDLAVTTADIQFDPPVVAVLPSVVTVNATIRNIGLTAAPAVQVALYEKAVAPQNKLQEQTVTLAAQSEQVVSFTATVSAGTSQPFYIVVDGDDLVPEKSEFNNTALKILYPDATYDFKISAADITLSESPITRDQTLTITVRIHNIGTLDAFDVPFKIFIDDPADPLDIAIVTADIPAGAGAEKEVAWVARRQGTDLPLTVTADSSGLFAEVSENNNTATVALTVNPHPEPNLILTHEAISIAPDPANEGGDATLSAVIRNDGGSAAANFKVAFYRGVPGDASELIGNRSIASLPAGESTTAVVEWSAIPVRGEQVITVVADADEQIAEFSETDNDAFIQTDIRSLPDFVVSRSAVVLTPPTPLETEPLSIAVTVQNAGEQDGQNVVVGLYEKAERLSTATVPLIPGNSQETVTMTYDTAGQPGSHTVEILVDPDLAIAEQNEDNNRAVRSFGVQNENLFLTDRYLAHGGPDSSGDTRFSFRLEESQTVTIVVVDAKGRVIRTFAGEEFENISGGTIPWDGRDERGRIVPDGLYQIQVRDAAGTVIAGLPVTVDNNRSPIAEAVGTDYLLQANLSCFLPYFTDWRWFGDESGIVFHISEADEDAPEYPSGLYTVGPDGEGILRIVPFEWNTETDPKYIYRYGPNSYEDGFYLSPDNQQVAFILKKYLRSGNRFLQSRLGVVDRVGENRIELDLVEYQDESGSIQPKELLNAVAWAPDSTSLAYKVRNEAERYDPHDKLFLIQADAGGKIELPWQSYQTFNTLRWAPDASKLAYDRHSSDDDVVKIILADPAGDTREALVLDDRRIDFFDWLNNHVLAVVERERYGYQYNIWLVDAAHDPPQAVRIAQFEYGDRVSSPAVNALDGKLAFLHAQGSDDEDGGYGGSEQDGEDRWSVRVCDAAGQCDSLHEAPAFSYFDSLSDLNWSADGSRLAVVDHVYEQIDTCEYNGYLVTMDLPTDAKDAFKVSSEEDPCDFGETYHIATLQDSQWQERGTLHYRADYETQQLDLSLWLAGQTGPYQLRITQHGLAAAHVDAVALVVDGVTYAPSGAVNTSASPPADILAPVATQDSEVTDAHQAALEFTWDNVPAGGLAFTLVMVANEVDFNDGDGGADEEPEDPEDDLYFHQGSLQWLPDGISLMGRDNVGVFVIATDSGVKTYLPVGENNYNPDPGVSPQGRYITYYQNVAEESICFGRGYRDLWAMSSMLNLTADLRIQRNSDGILLKGIAMDLNFASYTLEYADITLPDEWNLVAPPADTPVVNDEFALWVPPYVGTFLVRLTVTDLAGNTAQDRKRVTWGQALAVTNLFKTEELFSPANGDGVKDTVQLHYRVVAPVHLEFFVFDENENVVRTFVRDYPAAPPGEGTDFIAWDGRDENGSIVPDGHYTLRVLDYSFSFEVDNRLPSVHLAFSPIQVRVDFLGNQFLAIDLAGHVDDRHLKRWSIEYGEGENPQIWFEHQSGSGAVFKHDRFGRPELDAADQLMDETFWTFGEESLGFLTGKKFRIVAEDTAGNQSTWVSGFIEEILVIHQWEVPDDVIGLGDWFRISLARLEDGTFRTPDELPATLSRAGRHLIRALSTFRRPLDRFQIQYRIGMDWFDGADEFDPAVGLLELLWDNAELDVEDIDAVRIKAVDSTALAHFSNPVPLKPVLEVNGTCRPKGTQAMGNPFTAKVLPFEDLKLLKIQIQRGGGEWSDSIVYDADQGDTVPLGIFPLWGGGLPPGGLADGDLIRPFAIGVNDAVYYGGAFRAPPGDCPADNTTAIMVVHGAFRAPPGDCPEEPPEPGATDLGGGAGTRPGAPLELVITYEQATECDTLAPGGVFLLARLNTVIDSPLVSLSYYIQDSEQARLLQRFDLATEGWNSYTVDSLALEEGVYPVSTVLEYESGTGTAKIKASDVIVVDRMLPEARITRPSGAVKVCPIRVETARGERFVVDVLGSARDNRKVTRQHLFYGIGDDPQQWIPIRTLEPALAGLAPDENRLALWDITELRGDVFTLRLEVQDEAGNLKCDILTFSLDTVEALTALADKKLFSPNGDGILDDVTISYTVEEEVTIDVQIYQDANLVKTVAANIPHAGGAASVLWDGTDNSLAAAADGKYRIVVSATDGCGNVIEKRIDDVEVDNTPPDTIIAFPQPSDPLTTVVEISGTVDDQNFLNFRLEVLNAGDPEKILADGEQPRRETVLGVWNTFGSEGQRSLKLFAQDKAGNRGEILVDVDLGQRQNLFTDLAADPVLFSPNDDGKLEQTDIRYILNSDLNETFDVTLEILDGTTVVYSRSTNGLAAAAYTETWDGRDTGGQVVADGAYTVVLTAALSANAGVNQKEQVTVFVDATPPEIAMAGPADEAFLPGAVTVLGSITDANITSYTITNTGDDGALPVDSATQNRENHTFATLNDLADGRYTIDVAAEDLGQNVSRTAIRLTQDRTPPKVTIDSPASGDLFGGESDQIRIDGTVDDANIATWTLRYRKTGDTGDWTALRTSDSLPAASTLFDWAVGPADGLADGNYTLSLYAKDKAGWEKEVQVSVTIDNTPPDLVISEPADDGYVLRPMDVAGTAWDPHLDEYLVEVSAGTCVVAERWLPLATSDTAVQDGTLAAWKQLPADGDYCLSLEGFDTLGNTDAVRIDLLVDTQPPAAPVLSGEVVNGVDADLNWTANSEPDLAGYNLYRDGARLNGDLLGTVQYTDLQLAEATYGYVVKAVDFAGWESDPSNEVRLRIDLTGPLAQIRVPGNSDTVNDLVQVKGTAYSEDDFKEYRVYTGPGAAPADWTLINRSSLPLAYGILAPWDTAFLAEDAIYAVKLEAEDLTGNVSTDQVVVQIDNTPPAAPVLIAATAAGSTADVNWQANSEPDLAGYLLFSNDRPANVDGNVSGDLTPFLIVSTLYADTGLPDGKYTYYVVAQDRAGNTSGPSNKQEVTIDTRPPAAVIAAPPDQHRFEDTLSIRAESQDQDIAAVQFQYQRSVGGTWQDLGAAVSVAPYVTTLDPAALGLAFDYYDLRAVATDTGGQTDPAPARITVIYTDITPPTAPIALQARTNGSDVTLTWTANSEADLDGYNVYEISQSPAERQNSTVVGDTAFIVEDSEDRVYTFEVRAVDIFGNESDPSNPATATVYTPVLEPPFTPTAERTINVAGGEALPDVKVELLADAGSGNVSQGSVDADAAGRFAGDVALEPGENRITARAADADGNTSKESEPVAVVSNLPPAAPTGLAGSTDGYDVTLTWNANSEPDVIGYNVRRDDTQLNRPTPFYGGFASASTYNWRADDARDGNSFSYWIAYFYDADDVRWWQLDLGRPVLISRLDLDWYSSNYYAARDYQIQAWSGYGWLPLQTVTDNTDRTQTFNFDVPYRTDKIRIYITAARSFSVRLAELRIRQADPVADTTYLDESVDDGTYQYTVTAVDAYGFESPPSAPATVPVGDVAPPAIPLNLTAAAVASAVNLNWTAVDNPDLLGYHVYRGTPGGSIRLTAQPVPDPDYTDGDLANGTYRYIVTAVDQIGNESLPSNEASATVNIELPSQPINLQADALPEGGRIEVCWEDSGTAAPGYNVYRSASAGGPYVRVNSEMVTDTCYVDAGLVNGQIYYYVVTAVDDLVNESTQSNEANALPADLVAPDAPVLFGPTVAGVPVKLGRDTTDILGWAEPGALVEAFKAGVSLGSAPARAVDFSEQIEVGNGDESILQPALSPDGRTLAYVMYDDTTDEDALWLKNLLSGEETAIVPIAGRPQWSPDGTQLLYQYKDPNWDDHIAIYDPAGGTLTPVAFENNVEDEYPSWSADGRRIVFVSDRDRDNDAIWIKDLASGALTQVTAGFDAAYPRFSPDGRKIAYLNWDDYSLYVLDLDDGASILVDDAIVFNYDYPLFAWSPDSERLAFVSYRSAPYQAYWFDAATQGITVITNADDDITAFDVSPDGQQVAYVVDGEEVFTLPTATAAGEPRLIGEFDDPINSLSWTARGDIILSSYYFIQRISPQGGFRLNGVGLDVGDNRFTARATDAAGNGGPLAEEILVILDPAQLPDLTVSAADIYLFPAAPIAGETLEISIFVGNIGDRGAENIDLTVYTWDSTGRLELVNSETLAALAPGDEALIQFNWDTTGRTGPVSLIVDLDPDGTILEASEENNFAVKDFVVSEQEEISLDTALDAEAYEANQEVLIDVTVYNSVAQTDADLEVRVVDAAGVAVADVAQQQLTLLYGVPQTYRFTWNTATTFAGSYQVKAVLVPAAADRLENLVPFTITPDIRVDSNLTTDRSRYEPDQDVHLTATVTQLGENYLIPELEAVLTVKTDGDAVLFTEVQSLVDLFPALSVNVAATWNTANYAPGTYRAVVEVLQPPEFVSTSESFFEINETAVFTGSLELAPTAVQRGVQITADYTVTNNGNADAFDLPLAVALVDPDDGTRIAVRETAVDLAAAGSVAGQFFFESDYLDLKTYWLQLEIEPQGEPVTLATAVFAVQDDDAWADSPAQQVSGTLAASPDPVIGGDPVTLDFTATNDGAEDLLGLILRVEVIDPFTDTLVDFFELPTALPVNVSLAGDFAVATDDLALRTYQAVLMLVSAAIVEPKTLAVAEFTVDTQVHAPVAVTGGPYIATVGEAVTVDGSASYDPDEGRSESGDPPFDGITTYEWEAEMIAPFDFDDAQGAEAELPAYDLPGFYETILLVTDNTAQAFPGEGQEDLQHGAAAQITVYAAGLADLYARPKSTKVQLVWTHAGAAEYEILRSEKGPNEGYVAIATTDSIYSTYLDNGIELYTDYWYRVRAKIGGEPIQSQAVYVYSRGRRR